MELEDFRNPMAVAAVERELQIIGEVATRLGDASSRDGRQIASIR
jgi:uncharacterized protein with HEPN domain